MAALSLSRPACLSAQAGSPCPASSDWAGLNVFGSNDAELRPPTAEQPRIVFLGDDLTANWTPAATGLFHDPAHVNRGIARQTTPQMLVRFRQDVVDLQPRVVVIEGGMNDIAGVTGPATEATITENIASMIDVAKAHGIKVIIAAVSPVCDCVIRQTRKRPIGKIEEVNESLRGLARQTGSVFLDYFAVLADPQTFQMKKELTDDGLLPNSAGYVLLERVTAKAVNKALVNK